MKKTYISPNTKVTKVQLSQSLLTLSTTDRSASVTDGKVTLESRDNNSWDIWGGDDYDDEY
ncbi:MAG: hypothetical protein IJT19_08995 [Bacteroidaceae bacterium]|nr:hypothetical protein [Bacteroidaceae bacterium]